MADPQVGITLNGDTIETDLTDASATTTGSAVTTSGIEQDITITSGGVIVWNGGGARIMGGQTAYDTGTGFFLGHVSGDNRYKFSIGDSSGEKLTFDDGDLTVTGKVYYNSHKFDH